MNPPIEIASGGVRAAAPPSGGFLFRHRNILGPVLAVFLVLFPLGRLAPNVWYFLIGFVLVLCGVSLRIWSILQIGGSARKTSKCKAVRIISWGPFALLRNPIYVANATVFAGFTVLSGLVWAVPAVLLILWVWYDIIVRQEEAFLARTFPAEYGEYKKFANRWIPKLHFRRRPVDVPRYPFLRALKRERGHLISVGAGAAAVVLFRMILI